MSLDAGDAGRLQGIERQLAEDDPGFAAAFRRWRAPAPEHDELPRGYTAVAPWMLAVFAVGLLVLLGNAVVAWIPRPAVVVVAAVLVAAWSVGTAGVRRARRLGGLRTYDPDTPDPDAGGDPDAGRGPSGGRPARRPGLGDGMPPNFWPGRWM